MTHGSPRLVPEVPMVRVILAAVAMAAQVAAPPAPPLAETLLRCASLTVSLTGEWSERTTMWDDAALVFHDRPSGWRVLDAGSNSARTALQQRTWASGSTLTWSL